MDRFGPEPLIHFLEAAQVNDGPLAGGMREGFRPGAGYEHIYSETTGYAATFFLNAARVQRSDALRKRGVAAADFLVRHVQDGYLPYSYPLDGTDPDPRAFTFDNGIIVSGLLDAFNETHAPRYLDTARAIVDWMRTMYDGLDAFRSSLDVRTGARVHPGEGFADDGGCLHLKNAIGLIKLGGALHDATITKWAASVLDAGLNRQRADGGFPLQRGSNRVFSHAHCYATEAYLYGFLRLGTPIYRTAVERSARYLASRQSFTGGVFQFDRSGGCAADATAQAVRVWRSLALLSGNELYAANIHRAVRFLRGMRVRGAGEDHGSLRYVRGRLGGRAAISYTWVAMFAGSAANLLAASEPTAAEVY